MKSNIFEGNNEGAQEVVPEEEIVPLDKELLRLVGGGDLGSGLIRAVK